MTYTRIRY